MAEPTKHEISLVFKRLRSTAANKVEPLGDRGCGRVISLCVLKRWPGKSVIETFHLVRFFSLSKGLLRLSSEEPYLGFRDVRGVSLYRL